MTERAQKVKEAFWGNTEYPDDLDECNLANALREVVIEVILKYMPVSYTHLTLPTKA